MSHSPRSGAHLVRSSRRRVAAAAALVVPLDARCSIQTSAAGDVWIDASHMHLFEPASGDDLTLA